MKNLDEMKLLARMARNLGQPDLDLENRIKLEEDLNKRLFAKPKEEPIQILKEEQPPNPAPAFVPPKKDDIIQQTVNAISSPKFAKQELPDFQQKEIDAIRKQIAEIIQRMGTLSWGGGGTGIVKLWDGDDLIRSSREDDKQFLTHRNGYFQFDYINPSEIVANTVYITSNNYQITKDDYYIGVNCASTVTITLPPFSDIFTGREYYVKDESGNASAPARWIDIYPSGSDKIDGQNYVRLQIDYGGLKFIYRDGWRVI